MRQIKDPHLFLRNQILGDEAQRVIDAEFREILPRPNDRHSPLGALKAWLGRMLSGRMPAFGETPARLREAVRPRR